MNPIRVLIVDDSVLARRLITNALSRHPEIAVVGTAENGALALTKLPQLTPDAVLLDVEMPEMDGIATLKRIRELYPRLPVLMFSTLTERSARVTLEALSAGANDYVLKPSPQQGETLEGVISQVIVPKLTAIVRAPLDPVRHASGTHAPVSLSPQPFAGKEPARVVAIAAATGGPNALADVIPLLSRELAAPVLVAQHMAPIFSRCLAERLAERSRVQVIESQGDEWLSPGTVYIAPGNVCLTVERQGERVRTRLVHHGVEHARALVGDVLFRSVAEAYGPGALGVVLTGIGSDAKLGAKAIVEAGGHVLVQSRSSCVVWGMPRAVEEARLCDAVVPLGDMARSIEERVRGTSQPSLNAQTGH